MRILALISILVVSNTVVAQNAGLYGKKTQIEVSGTGFMPIAYNLFGSDEQFNFKNKKGKLVDSKDLFDYGVRFNLTRAMKNNFAMGLEVAFDFNNATAVHEIISDYWPTTINYEFKHEQLSLSTMNIIPKLIFASSGDLLPIGLSHQIGVGYTKTKIVDKDYLFETDYPGDTTTMDIRNSYTGYIFLYEMHLSTPITSNLTLNYGIRYNFNFLPKNQNPIGAQNYMTEYELNRIILRKRMYNFINFSFGIGYTF